MVNKSAKGNYYKNKVKKFYEAEGYFVVNAEMARKMFIKGKIILIKSDLLGADLIVMNTSEIIFVQVKSNAGDVNKGLSKFEEYPFPDCVRRVVAYWAPRAKEPELHEL